MFCGLCYKQLAAVDEALSLTNVRCLKNAYGDEQVVERCCSEECVADHTCSKCAKVTLPDFFCRVPHKMCRSCYDPSVKQTVEEFLALCKEVQQAKRRFEQLQWREENTRKRLRDERKSFSVKKDDYELTVTPSSYTCVFKKGGVYSYCFCMERYGDKFIVKHNGEVEREYDFSFSEGRIFLGNKKKIAAKYQDAFNEFFPRFKKFRTETYPEITDFRDSLTYDVREAGLKKIKLE